MRLECLLQGGAFGGEYLQGIMLRGDQMRGGDLMGADRAHFDLAEFGKLDTDLEFAAVLMNAKLAGLRHARYNREPNSTGAELRCAAAGSGALRGHRRHDGREGGTCVAAAGRGASAACNVPGWNGNTCALAPNAKLAPGS